MTTASDPQHLGAPTIVTYDEPPVKPPPMLIVGPLAWLRDNLFSSRANTLLTLVFGALAIVVVAGMFNWVVTQANWYAVVFNLRQFMLGRYEVEAEWRIALIALIVAFVAGLSLAAWARIPRTVPILVILVLALAFIVPVVVDATVPLPPTYLVAGDVDVVSGTSTQEPVPQLGFIARAGETIRLDLAESLSTGDEQLGTLHSFGDIGANLLRAAASNRLTNQARTAEINAMFAADTPNNSPLTTRQRAALETELGRLTVPDPVTETYALNQTPIEWRILRGSTFEPVAEGALVPGGDGAAVTLPEDGWYILEKTGEGLGLLETYGIYPLIQHDYSRSEVRDESGAIVQAAGRYSDYSRMTDNWTTAEVRPRVDGRDVPMVIIIDTQYRGDGILSDWLRLYVSPFLQIINEALLLIAIAAVLGYAVARVVDRGIPAKGKTRNPRILSQRASIWLLTALPILMFIISYGFGSILPTTKTNLWGGLFLTVMLTMVATIGSFPLGILLALGRRSTLPVVRTACIIYIEFVRGVPLIAVLFMAQLLLPLINPALTEVDGVFRAMVGITLFSAAYLAENVRGGLQAIPHGQEEAAKALGLAGWQITLFITLPQALRLVIPALVGQFISLFKDTSRVAIVGLIDLLGISNTVVAQTEFIGTRPEVYVFITIIYFIFSYAMAAISRRIEASGSGAARRV